MEFQENVTLMVGSQKFITKETAYKIILGVYTYRIYAQYITDEATVLWLDQEAYGLVKCIR